MSSLSTVPDVVLATWCHAGGWGWWPFIPLLWFLFFFGFVFLVFKFGFRGRRRWYAEHWAASGTQAGKAKLAERYAAGEIDEAEYRARLAVLDQSTRNDGP